MPPPSTIMTLFYIILAVIAIIIIRWIIKTKFKAPKMGNMVMVNGAVKAGKTTYAVYLATKLYCKAHRRWKVRFFVQRHILRKDCRDCDEEPLLFSNIPLSVKGYSPLTIDHIMRRVRFPYRSVIYVCESSLVADSMLCKDNDINNTLLLFNKLIAHETKGGYLIYDTQSVMDNHFAVKRCIGSYLYVHHMIKWLPFVLLASVRELAFFGEASTSNVSESDFEDGLKTVFIPKKVWKTFDCYCYSCLTDGLACRGEKTSPDTLKAQKIISLRGYDEKKIR